MIEATSSLETNRIESIERFDDFSLVWLKHVPVAHGAAVPLLSALAAAAINVNQMTQITDRHGTAHLMVTIPTHQNRLATAAIEEFCAAHEGTSWGIRPNISRIVLTGTGIRTHSLLAATVIDLLEAASIRMEMIGTSEMSLSLYIQKDQVDTAEKLLRQQLLSQE